MIAGPQSPTPIHPIRRGACTRSISCATINCSTMVPPAPPYSSGHVTPTRPPEYRTACARLSSATTSVEAPRATTSVSRLSAMKARTRARNSASSGASSTFIGPASLVAQANAGIETDHLAVQIRVLQHVGRQKGELVGAAEPGGKDDVAGQL